MEADTVDADMVDADMVDEPHAAADAASPAAATALDWDAADATEGGTVSILLSWERTKPAAG